MSMKKQILLQRRSVPALKTKRRPKQTFVATLPNKKPVTRVGETINFIVDYDSTEKIILVYGKEALTSHGFKLGLSKDETEALMNLLAKAETRFDN